ncbi:NAD(+) diphosphatase [Alloprevotella sp. OH1205_COT-284]|nr:NAD(+) diphosphatase [Alloprevotella sp. OH1205_COT-284]
MLQLFEIFMSEKKWFIFYRDEILLTQEKRLPCSPQLPKGLETPHAYQELPEVDGVKNLAVRSDVLPDEKWGYRHVGLRASHDVLPLSDFRLASKARELLHWDEQTRYCGRCGQPTDRGSVISKICSNCGNELWPTVVTAVIVLVYRRSVTGNRDDDELLLVRGRNFPGNYFGLVAGFVETGESMEEALVREVKEETGLEVTGIEYRASQPWPFPSVLMSGFFAEYKSGELTLQREELLEGGWFKRNALPVIPGKVSLARRLIEMWLEE